MTKAAEFLGLLDEEGRFRQGDGDVDIVLTTAASSRYPGKLHFEGGLCVRVEMQNGGTWAYSDNSPLSELRLLLHFEGDNPHVVFIDGGRVVRHFEAQERPSKKEFLSNLRVARNLFLHPKVETNGGEDQQSMARRIARAAIWLTPKSVRGFNADDFPELGPDRQRVLQSAVTEFRDVAKTVPPQQAPSEQQVGNAKVAFANILDLLGPYLQTPEEDAKVEKAIDNLQSGALPTWVVNWDYELGSDEEGGPAVWINLFVEEGAPSREFGRTASQLIPKLRQALTAQGVTRWPYVRIRTAAEHKAG